MSSTLAKEILGELKVRRTLGDRIMARVGRWGWERPRVAVSSRIFRLYRIPDPWDPLSKEDDAGPGVVSQRFSEDRRKPAPHALPKEEKSKTPSIPAKAAPARPADARTPNTPQPPENKPAAAPDSRPSPTPRVGETSGPMTAKPPAFKSDPIVDARSGMSYIPKQYDKAKDKSKERPLLAPSRQRVEQKAGPAVVGRLPVRPGTLVAEPVAVGQAIDVAAAAKAAARVRAAAPVSAEARRPPMPQRAAPPAGKGPARRAGRVSLGPAVVVTSGSDEMSMDLEVELLAPAPAPVLAAPVAPPALAPSPQEPTRHVPAPKPGRGDDMDDMFAASLNEGRMRLGKPKAKT